MEHESYALGCRGEIAVVCRMTATARPKGHRLLTRSLTLQRTQLGGDLSLILSGSRRTCARVCNALLQVVVTPSPDRDLSLSFQA
jgi:hypothetical protein